MYKQACGCNHHYVIVIIEIVQISIFFFIELSTKQASLQAFVIWASSQENLSSGFRTKRVSNQSPHLQRPARILKFHL